MTSFLKTLPLFVVLTSCLEADLIAHWRFDESTGSTAVDDVSGIDGNWHPGSDATPDWRDNEGILGGAVEFPGLGNHLNHFKIAGFPTLNGTPDGMTISVWLKPNGESGYRGVLMTRTVSDTPGGGGTGQNYGLAHENNHVDGRVSGGAVDSPGGTLPTSASWSHVAWVWDNATGNHKI